MSYQVLARKWRPRNFKELVGQEHVQRALVNALDNNRIHHAFLFTGTRGVGKTTIARILAKSLNCETGVTSTPCGQCSTCVEINEGRFVDLIEVDAASRTKVEDTRELLENVQYAPTRGRYKVYLIDEVHMLSTHSFNALLKTLEEPPLHVKFLLATTDPQKLPVTILSRCLQFNLKRLPVEQIRDHLQHILSEEKISSDDEALIQIAKAADGSMRDALSLLDQAIAYGGGGVRSEEVRAMLGTIEHHHILDILRFLANGDADAVLQKSQILAEHAFDFAAALDELITNLHFVALAQVAPQALDAGLMDVAEISKLAASLSAEDVQLFYQMALIGRRDLPLAPDPRMGFNMVLLRMLAFKPATDNGRPNTVPSASTTTRSNTATTQPVTPSVTQSTQLPHSQMPPAGAAAAIEVREPPGKNFTDVNRENSQSAKKTMLDASKPSNAQARAEDLKWEQLVDRLDLGGITQQLALNCCLKQQTASALKLEIAESRRQLLSPARLEALQTAINHCLGDGVKVSVEVATVTGATPAELKNQRAEQKQHQAEQSIYSDQTVKTFINTFDAQIAPDSITPVD